MPGAQCARDRRARGEGHGHRTCSRIVPTGRCVRACLVPAAQPRLPATSRAGVVRADQSAGRWRVLVHADRAAAGGVRRGRALSRASHGSRRIRRRGALQVSQDTPGARTTLHFAGRHRARHASPRSLQLSFGSHAACRKLHDRSAFRASRSSPGCSCHSRHSLPLRGSCSVCTIRAMLQQAASSAPRSPSRACISHPSSEHSRDFERPLGLQLGFDHEAQRRDADLRPHLPSLLRW